MKNNLKNNLGDEFEVLKEYTKRIRNRNFTMWLIKFKETGSVREVYKSNAEKGKAKDKYKVSFCGAGYDGDFEITPYWKQARRLWSNMLKRCYDPNYEAGYYGRGYSVDARWKCFANFLKDIPNLKNFEKWLEGLNPNKPKYNLDKDLILPGNKIYCKQFCSFVPESVNKAAGAKNGKPFTKKKRINKK